MSRHCGDCKSCYWRINETSKGEYLCRNDRTWRKGKEADDCPTGEYKRNKNYSEDED